MTTKENRGQRLVRKASGIRKSVSKSVTKKMDIYETVFEEARRKSFKRRQSTDDHELDWTNKTNYAGVKVSFSFLTLIRVFLQSLLVKYVKGTAYQNLTRLYLAGCQLNKLPEGLERIPLETISLEGNKFRDFPLVLCKMVTLKCLYLR